MQLNQLDYFPDELYDCDAKDLHAILGGPTLISLHGNKQPGLFVSVLLHGNEPSGWYAAQKILLKYRDQNLPRDLHLFIGNTEAAAQGLRYLDHQVDFNRQWPESDAADCEEKQVLTQAYETMKETGLFASIDVHNNTGLNPHYACINKLNTDFLSLAQLFSRTVVYFLTPKGVQSLAFSTLCPATTIECGKPDSDVGMAHAAEFIDSCLHLDHFPDHPPTEQDIDVFHTVARVHVAQGSSFSFHHSAADIAFNEDLDRLNFQELSSGTSWASIAPGSLAQLIAVSENGDEVTDNYFDFSDNRIRNKKPIMPSMLTLDERIVQQDCLCYLMERIHLD